MKTINKFFTLAFTASVAVACNNAPEGAVEATDAEEVATSETITATYAVVVDGDEIMWEGYETFSGDSHNGSLQVIDGNLNVEEDQLVGGNFTIDMTSINDMDLAENPDSKAKLEGHLKSGDFFAVDSFPKAMFEITEVKAVDNDTTGATHHLSGNLTLRGITKNITVPAMVNMENDMIMVKTPEFVIDRSKWNVRFRSTSFAEFANVAKDKAIDNNLKLQVNLKAAKA
jgi:polyisoprenoid-binding protein YceI